MFERRVLQCLSTAGAIALAGLAFVEIGHAETPAGGPKAETANYVAEIKAVGSYKPGVEGIVEVTLVPKGEYHTNAQYPYRFKASDPPPEGVTFPKPTLSRADGTFEEKKGTFKVPFVVAKAGKATIGGTLSLSVCSVANCLVDKVPLAVTVDVK